MAFSIGINNACARKEDKPVCAGTESAGVAQKNYFL